MDRIPPPGRLTTDANTLFLLQSINQTNGSSTFTDTGAGTANATGNYTTATQTANSAVTKVGIVLLYKNVSGTASLNAGNDFYAEVSANGGTNYSAVTLTSSGTFSTGINIAVANSVAVTSGTTIKARISWANQSSGSKETQLHGVAPHIAYENFESVLVLTFLKNWLATVENISNNIRERFVLVEIIRTLPPTYIR